MDENGITKVVSERIGIPLTFIQKQGETLLCRSERHSYAIIGYLWSQGYIVRGVVRSFRLNGRYSWLCNGQVGIHGKQVDWWEESGENSFVIPQ